MNLLFIDGETVVEAPVVENAEVNTIAEVSAGEPVADAVAEQPSQPGGGWSFWVMIIAMIAIMYFFMWRPESKRRKQMETFRKGLKKGDKVITAGGIYGTIKEVHETSLLIEVDSNVTLRVDKNMVVADAGSVVNK
ncbi:MAG: preprotein translocase subunit YajC [Alistipes sp.]|nr:preprotein translocase subunit YajC [Alistipes sp.]MBR6630566.1 preprotein translocase subunit YajC [Alistipes sp.]